MNEYRAKKQIQINAQIGLTLVLKNQNAKSGLQLIMKTNVNEVNLKKEGFSLDLLRFLVRAYCRTHVRENLAI